ncbi:ATP phosphoribosyltransferase regulatory subunit [Alteromonadaceae bacterium Bs31]|nr:ATP phosphoribosyltransferase regulatory subunit [Alteromonadaceae bacterium Bs31]
MSKLDRWLLPDGIEEMLPQEASRVEALRRRLVDGFRCWGYDYVIPPMVEFTDSLLTGSGGDIELLTFKVTDQLSGKTMGVRADITPQAARMDAHSLQREGVNRLCYAGHVLHARPKVPLASRTPIWVGVELFGEAGIEADIEVVSLLLDTLKTAGLPQYIDIGHVGIFRALATATGLNSEQEEQLFTLLQAKATTDIQKWAEANIADKQQRAWIIELPKLSGSVAILEKAKSVLTSAPAEVFIALDELGQLARTVQQRYDDAQIHFDLSELRGYHYHTGIVFGAFTPGEGEAIANGGRYDHIGEAFGRRRPATGFSANLSVISRVLQEQINTVYGIFAPVTKSASQWQKIAALRAQGERVIVGFTAQQQPLDYQNCNRLLVERDGEFIVENI